MSNTLVEETIRQSSTVARFATMQPAEFRSAIDRKWLASDQLKDTVVEQVESENLTPIEGVAILACLTGQLYGYAEFHGVPSPASMGFSALSGQSQAR